MLCPIHPRSMHEPASSYMSHGSRSTSRGAHRFACRADRGEHPQWAMPTGGDSPTCHPHPGHPCYPRRPCRPRRSLGPCADCTAHTTSATRADAPPSAPIVPALVPPALQVRRRGKALPTEVVLVAAAEMEGSRNLGYRQPPLPVGVVGPFAAGADQHEHWPRGPEVGLQRQRPLPPSCEVTPEHLWRAVTAPHEQAVKEGAALLQLVGGVVHTSRLRLGIGSASASRRPTAMRGCAPRRSRKGVTIGRSTATCTTVYRSECR